MAYLVLKSPVVMKSKILLTSFQTWLDHHQSNSSDDLLELLQWQDFNDLSLCFLRHLPVDIQSASEQVISKIQNLKPDAVICCGMAEYRKKLSIEANATCQADCLHTSINLPDLIGRLTFTDISQDAGKFVCEGLYYQVLKYTQFLSKNIPCIFIHVPILNGSNITFIQQDALLIIKYVNNFCCQINC